MNPFDDILVNPASFSFNDLIGQDRWVSWNPIRTGWTDVGTPTVTGRFQVKGRLCLWQAKVIPGTTIATTAGASYFVMPVPSLGIGGMVTMFNATTNIAVGVGGVDVNNSTGRAHLPTQVASGNTFTFTGWYEI